MNYESREEEQEESQRKIQKGGRKEEPVIERNDSSSEKPALGNDERSFWQERKESFVRLKQWEEDRTNKSHMFGRILLGMLESILHRMANSSFENETFVSYFELYIKYQTEHSLLLTKNVNKHLDPLKQVYEAQGSQYKDFIQSLKELDVAQANQLVEMSKKLKDLIKNNLQKNTDALKKACESLQSEFSKKQKNYIESQKQAQKLFQVFCTHFDQNENGFRNGVKQQGDKDLWYIEYQYVKAAKENQKCINDLKEMLLKSWEEGKEREIERIKCIKSLYDDIILNNKKAFGASEGQEKIIKQINQVNYLEIVNELFSFRALITQQELKALMQLSDLVDGNIDFINTNDNQIKNFIKDINFDEAPESNLIIKKSIIKRESGAFGSFKDSTSVLTRDNFLYVFDWNILKPQAQTFTDPKLTINLNNCQAYEIKKDMKLEITESKKGVFSSTKKTTIKPNTIEDLEDWVNHLKRIVNK